MNNKWNKLKSPWGASSEKGSMGVLRDRTNPVLRGSRNPSTQSTTNLAPHSLVEDDEPHPVSENPTTSLSLKEQQQTASWQSKSQSIISSFRNRSSGSNSAKTAATITEVENEDHSGSNHSLDSAEVCPIQYEDLLSLPPKQISFIVVVNKSKRIGHTCHQSVHGVTKTSLELPECGEDLNTSQKGLNLSYDVCDIGAILGVNLIKNTKTKHFEVSELELVSLQDARPLLSPRQTILLVEGDKLQSINGFRVQRCRDLNQLCQRIIQEQYQEEMITLTFVCSPSDRGEQPQPHTPVVHQVTLVIDKDDQSQQVAADCKALIRCTDQPLFHSERLIFNTVTKEERCSNSQMLHLDSIPVNNWLEHSCARPNDVVLAINAIPCYELYPHEANMVLQTMMLQATVQTHSCVHIKFYSPPLNRKESMKRAAIATAGGALVGTGAIIMATPLHPIGHAMALGGLGVLGTEFEGPKKALTRVTDAARRIRSTNNGSGQPI